MRMDIQLVDLHVKVASYVTVFYIRALLMQNHEVKEVMSHAAYYVPIKAGHSVTLRSLTCAQDVWRSEPEMDTILDE